MFRSFLRRPEAGALISLLVIILFFVIIGGADLMRMMKAASWINFAAHIGIVAIPVGLLMISGELDISFAAMIPGGSMLTAIVSGYYGQPLWVAMLAVVVFAILIGLLNGFLTTRTSVPSLIVTLGTLVIVQGIVLFSAKILTGEASVAIEAPLWGKTIFGSLLGRSHQVIILWWIGFVAIFAFIVHLTPIGNWIFAMGGDRDSARNAGIPVDKITYALFILSATAAGFVGFCDAIQFNSAQVSGGMNTIFYAIVSVVVGGVILTGGLGSVSGIFLGTITLAIVIQGIYFTDIDRNWSNLIIGATLLIAVAMNEQFRVMAMNMVSKKEEKP